MPCDTRLKRYRNGRRQTISERKDEVRLVRERFVSGLKSGKVKAVVDKKGGIAFSGLTEEERDGVTDACVYRYIINSGSQLAIQAILRAELAAGRKVDHKLVAMGYHSHDGGTTWHNHD